MTVKHCRSNGRLGLETSLTFALGSAWANSEAAPVAPGTASVTAPMNLLPRNEGAVVPESISPTPKRPAPVVPLPSSETEWLFDVGAGLALWPWTQPPDAAHLRRARTPRAKAKSGHVPVFAYSVTTKTHLHLESGLEHDLVRELDRQSDVTWLAAQPCRLRLPAKRHGRRLEHTPDVLSRHTDGTVRIWDVRPLARQDEDFTLKSRLTAEACAEVGWRYEIFAGMARVRRVNVMWLYAYRRPMPWYAGSLRRLREHLELSRTIGDVLDLDAGGGHVISAMWYGIWSGELECDLDQRLKRTTRIRVAECNVGRS